MGLRATTSTLSIALLLTFACLLPAQEAPSGGANPVELKAIHRESPMYPENAAPNHHSGEATVKVIVNESGKVESAEAVSGDAAFYKEAVAAAKKWKFEQCFRDGKPIRVATNITFGFGFRWRAQGWPPTTSEPPNRVRVSQGVSQQSILRKVNPEYPERAKRAMIQGSVVFRAIIGTDGNVKQLDTLSGPLELQFAAGEAVRQWQYKPYFLNGELVEVESQITVNYTMSPM